MRDLHGVESTHLRSEPVRETFEGETVCKGVVEVCPQGTPEGRRGLRVESRDRRRKPPLRGRALSRADQERPRCGAGIYRSRDASMSATRQAVLAAVAGSPFRKAVSLLFAGAGLW